MHRQTHRFVLLFALGIGIPFLILALSFTSFDVPGAVVTAGEGINAQGEIVGFYNDTAGLQHGFVLRNGSFTTVDVPGARDSFAIGINSRGDIVGGYDYDGVVTHGFLL